MLLGGVTGQAVANPVEGGDSLAIACRGLQNDAKALVEEYGRAGTTSARRDEILQELRRIGGDWDSVCRDTFGNIFKVRKPTAPLRAVGAAGSQLAPVR